MDVLLTEPFDSPAIDRLAETFSLVREPNLWQQPARLAERLREARTVLVRNQTHLTAEVLSAAERLEGIGRVGVGLDNIDMAAASRLGIVVVAPLDANATSVAEFAIGLLLSLARKIPEASRSTKGGHWERARFTGVELAGKRLLVCGLGRIGRKVAALAHAFGMGVTAFDPWVPEEAVQVPGLDVTLCPDLETALGTADFVSLHVPLTAETRGMFGERAFAACKPGCALINTSRGGVVDERALVEALRSGRLTGAALDVREVEPPACRGALEEMPNVVLTPHIASFTGAAQARTFEAVTGDIERLLRREPAVHFVNFPQPRRPQTPAKHAPGLDGRAETNQEQA